VQALTSVLTRLDIRLFGPVELADAGTPVPLGGPRLRTLFGLLALRVPEVVSRDALIEGIWDCTPPSNASTTLRAHVSYLRRATAATDVAIVTRAPGYALAVPTESVDVHRFEEDMFRSRVAAAAGRIEECIAHLRAALRLWRGEPLAGCEPGVWARAEVTRLQELRLHATEELCAAELILGQHAQAAAELESLVTRYPLRERLWELLMRALFQGGRQGDALRAFRRARARLIEDLGVEPGEPLRRLEAAILRGDVRARDERGGADPLTAVVGQRVHEPVADSLPAPLTSLVDRAGETAAVGELLRHNRLVTLTGPGGCGKTRLAIAVATEVSAGYADGVRFLDLSAVSDPDLVATAVAAVFGVPEDHGADPLPALARHLRPRQCLLVLDNCEHLARACAAVAEPLLTLCPALHVVATSRQCLGVLGELAWPVPPLPVPPPGPITLAQARRYGSVRLFLDRASTTVVGELTDADAPALAAICGGLDGLPLAVELAAARTTVLTVAEIAGRLHDPSLLRADRGADRPDHCGLDTTIAWSYDLLDPPMRARLRRLAVFSGGFTLTAAEAVWGAGSPPALDALADLVGRSLVVMRPQPDGARYQLLETIRRWLAARLADDPDEQRDARARHAAYHVGLAETADERLRGPDVEAWLARLGAEHENFRSALTWSGPAEELRLAVSLAQSCRLRGRYGEGRRWLEDALAHQSDDGTAMTGRALASAASFAFLVTDYQRALSYAERALSLHRSHGDHAWTARTLRLLGSIERERGDYRRSLDWINEALDPPGADATVIADVRQMAGFTAWLSGDLDTAQRLLDDALDRYTRTGESENAASTRIHLAAVALYRDRPARARELAEQALTLYHKLDGREGIAWARNILGLVELREGRPAAAIAALRGSLEVLI
jgi:predicted ATPase/DNA-binding SARP family transcriptional activator